MAEAAFPTDDASDADRAAMRARLRDTNINERSLLATDYLNHFNEVVMMLDLVPQMPECLDEVKSWAPKGYKDHFRDSAFHDRDLAIAAYDLAPPACRAAFEETVARLDDAVAAAIGDIDGAAASGDAARLAHAAGEAVRRVQLLIDVASALINGEMPTAQQREIDALLRG
jgi:hypothetical protein